MIEVGDFIFLSFHRVGCQKIVSVASDPDQTFSLSVSGRSTFEFIHCTLAPAPQIALKTSSRLALHWPVANFYSANNPSKAAHKSIAYRHTPRALQWLLSGYISYGWSWPFVLKFHALFGFGAYSSPDQ
jgi:hypothetical protein